MIFKKGLLPISYPPFLSPITGPQPEERNGRKLVFHMISHKRHNQLIEINSIRQWYDWCA